MATALEQAPGAGVDLASLYTVDDTQFKVHGQLYTAPEIFALEMERVFGRVWVYLGHDSEIPNPGDFKTSYIGLRPVILSRDNDGVIHVLLNRCRHRGSVLCREESGNTGRFTCRYHGWVYRLNGELAGVPDDESYPATFPKDELGLKPIARVELYRGMIFGNMSAQGPDLMGYLGEARRYIDYHFDRSPTGKVNVSYGTHRTTYHGNWKFQSENTTDGYHGDTTHESFFRLVIHFGNKGGQHGAYSQEDEKQIHQHRRTGCNKGFINGHGLLEYPVSPIEIERLKSGPFSEYILGLEQRYGLDGLTRIFNQGNMLIFPNLAFLHGQFRVIRPIAPDKTEITTQFYALEDVPDAYNAHRQAGYERFFGPAAFGQPDDIEIFAMNQTGIEADEVGWMILSRGIANEQTDNQGTRTGGPTDESSLRAFHRMWQRLMTTP